MTLSLEKIHCTPAFLESVKHDLGGDSSYLEEFKKSFIEFELSGDHYEFGKKSGPSKDKYLWHVHMVPINMPDALKKWNKDYENYARCTSDRYLFYAENTPNRSILLIDHVIDPGAHQIWTPQYRPQLQKMEKVAEDFHFQKTIPT